MAIKEKIVQIVTELDEIKKRLQKAIEEAFSEACKELFDSNADLKSFGWRQYTPYFNDGNTCTFGSYHDTPNINGYDWYDIPKELKPLSKTVQSVITVIPTEMLEKMFGDHVEITVTRDGVTTESYDHE